MQSCSIKNQHSHSHQQAKGEKPYHICQCRKGWGCSAVDSSPGLHRALFYPRHHHQGGKRQHRKSIWWNHDYSSETREEKKALPCSEALPADPAADGVVVRKPAPLLRVGAFSACFLFTKPGVKPRFSYDFWGIEITICLQRVFFWVKEFFLFRLFWVLEILFVFPLTARH